MKEPTNQLRTEPVSCDCSQLRTEQPPNPAPTVDRDRLQLLAKDLRREYPRSPRETLAGYVIAARTLDKCRALPNGTLGEYKFDCTLDRQFFSFAGIEANQFRDFVATGASDADMAEWIQQHAQPRPRLEIIKWNHRMRELRISELPDANQEFLEEYIRQYVPRHRPVYCWFDVYDLEEERL